MADPPRKMRLFEHLEDLRVRLKWSFLAVFFLFAFFAAFQIRTTDVGGVRVPYPFPDPLQPAASQFLDLTMDFLVPPDVQRAVFSPGEAVVVQLQTALYLSLVTGMPVVAYHMAKFVAHEADILIGTQMIAKGLHLPNVTLVGVISADVGLHLPDYRSAERTFQILTQVAGRAGRGKLAGRVIVQTYAPEHFAIQAASHHDYAAFYRQEIRFRREHDFPPFADLARLLYAHPNPRQAQREAESVAMRLRQDIKRLGLADISVIGPAPGFVRRLRGRYRWQVVLRGHALESLLAEMRLARGWVVDVDPVTLL